MEEKKQSNDQLKMAILPYPVIYTFSKLSNIFEARLFGWILAKAQSVLKLYNKDLRDINIEHAMDMVKLTVPTRYLLNYDDNNYRNARKAFTLADKKIEYEKDGNIYHLSIIAFPVILKRQGNSVLQCVLHNEIWHALLDFTRGHRLIDLRAFFELKSSYSIVMYILVSQQSQPMTYATDTLRKLLGVEDKPSYRRTFNLFARIIDPARAELDEKAAYSFDYSTSRAGLGGRYDQVIIIPRASKRQKALPFDKKCEEIQRQRLRLDERVGEYLATAFEMTAKEQEVAEPLLMRIGDYGDQLKKLADIKTAMLKTRVRNKKGYLINALRNQSATKV